MERAVGRSVKGFFSAFYKLRDMAKVVPLPWQDEEEWNEVQGEVISKWMAVRGEKLATRKDTFDVHHLYTVG
jgi:hypothetical protein